MKPVVSRCRGACRHTRFCVALTLVLVLLLGRLAAGVAQVRMDAATGAANTPRAEVVVTAKRHLTDEQLTEQIEKALAKDPYIYAEHVTVTTDNGVVRVEGIVQDTWEWFRILDLCRKMRDARRVDTSGIEMLHNDPDGG